MNGNIEKLTSFKNFRSDIQSDRLFHSIMLISPDSDFLMDYATALSAEILSASSTDKDRTKLKVEKGIHPDLMVFGVDKPMDANMAKDLVSTVHIAPYEGDRKVYILSRFDQMGAAAANKLLKTLEEPPTGVVFLLLVTNSSRVLQTLLSRSQKFYLEGYGVESVAEILRSRGVQDSELISLESDGNLTEALRLAESKNSAKIADFVLNTFEDLRLTTALSYAVGRAEEFKDSTKEMLNFFAVVAYYAIRVRAGKRETNFPSEINIAIQRIARIWNTRALIKLIDAVVEAQKRLEANVNVTNITDQFFLKILEVRRKCRV